MKKIKEKITWYHALLFGFAQIIDGIVTIFTLGKYKSDLAINVAVDIGRWRYKRKEKLWR